MAAGFNEKVVQPDTKCDDCSGPITIGKYYIRTWDETYRDGITMNDTIVHSDNTGMVFVARKLGAEVFANYLVKYGFGKKTGIELQEEATGVILDKDQYKDIDLATNSFGQGIAVTPIQILSAANTIASGGYYLRPTIIESTIPEPKRVLEKEAVDQITQVMINAVEFGEAKWAKPKGLTVAGKTGTAQIPVEGHYDPDKTIASFIGFFPVNDPKYTILVSLREPQTSIWGSETAAPLWFSLVKQLLL
jgi:cell division protein FtsI/penicillin-binding protein 2